MLSLETDGLSACIDCSRQT